MKTLKNFTRVYSLSKTLRFELKPVAETLEFINKDGLLEQDAVRAQSYVRVKRIIDEYHKAFIDRVLADFELVYDDCGKRNSLEEFYNSYISPTRDELRKKELKDIQDGLRKQISDRFKNGGCKRLFEKDLIKVDLLNFVDSDEDRDLLKEFRNFTTYFTGFNENRKNMYSAEAQSTAIAYRLIHENLPKFIDNLSVFGKVAECFDELPKDFDEILYKDRIADMFKLSYFNNVLTQSGIDIYNAIIGGKVLDDGTKVKGLNEYINLYNQRQDKKSNRLPKLKPLYKQILSDRNAISWLPEQFASDNELLEAVQRSYQDLNEHVLNGRSADGGQSYSLRDLLQSLEDYDLDRIYLRNDVQIREISQKVFGHWDCIYNALLEGLRSLSKRKKNETEDAYTDRLKGILKSQGSISIGQINRRLKGAQFMVQSYFMSLGVSSTGEDMLAQIEDAYKEVKDLLNTFYPEDKNLVQDKDSVERIKNLLDAIKNLQHFVKPLLGDGKEPDKDERFYGEFTALWEKLNDITLLYDKVRNYMTRKPYSTEKIKLNFENSTLMNGWDLNKEQDNSAVILRKDGLYYLAIMNKLHKQVFAPESLSSDGECYEKMEYKLLPGSNKMLPKVFISSKKGRDVFAPSERLLANYDKGTHKKGAVFNLNDCHELIDFFKSSIRKHKDWSKFDFKFSDTDTYESMEGFYREVDQQGYRISFRKVSVNYINLLVAEGKIYLFKIYNKDFSPYSKGTPNLHTLYWKMLFDERNLSDVVYKLNGAAEVFYRKSSLTYDKPTHPANQPVYNKNGHNDKSESHFGYDLIKDKRYTVDKFQFHVPITLNFKSSGNDNINPLVNEYIKECDDFHIIGIDRGERHLLYVTVIDLKGCIKEQYSLNRIVNAYGGKEYHTDYHDLLSKREDERMRARQSWQTIESIKDLKEGYLSQVVHKISELMVKYHAIVVLEDLNMGFVRGRQKVESAVYQKFEKMLIDKLNYLADKKAAPESEGGILNAYQFTNKFTSFQKLGKQSGFLFYVPAWNTSKIDPVTGFVNLFDTRYENIEKAKDFFGKFESICYNSTKDWFEFAFDYNCFTTRAYDTRTNWTLCTCGKRIETIREENGRWISNEIDLTERFKALFYDYGLDIRKDLKEQILSMSSADFFKRLFYLLKLSLQMRNSKIGSDVDYLQSPVADENGNFYNSNTCGDDLPQNADANGAYNIARKGLWMVRQIKAANDLSKVKLTISNKEWLVFAQKKPYSDQ